MQKMWKWVNGSDTDDNLALNCIISEVQVLLPLSTESIASSKSLRFFLEGLELVRSTVQKSNPVPREYEARVLTFQMQRTTKIGIEYFKHDMYIHFVVAHLRVGVSDQVLTVGLNLLCVSETHFSVVSLVYM
jgi:hypothetical protein